MAIEDHRGNEVETGLLTEELATITLSGVRTIWYDSVSNSLTPERLGQIMAQVDENGDIIEYLALAEEMEERDLHYHSVLSTRKLAVSSLDISVEAVADDATSTKHADFVREVFADEDTIRDLLSEQLDAIGKGFSVNEIMWDRTGSQWVPEKYTWRDGRFFQFDRTTGDIIHLRDEENLTDGMPLAAYKFLVHTPKIKTGLKIRSGLARLASVAYMCKGYSLKDWLAFAEVYGLPLRVGKYGAGASPAQKSELLRAVSNIGTDAAAIIPDSMMIDFVDGARSGGGIGEAVFERLANWLDRQVSKGVLGQTMTTDDGSSQSQAQVHNDVRSDIRASDARQLGATLHRDLVKPLIDLNFGEQARRMYPRIKLVIEEPEDLESLSKSLTPFIDRGLRVEESVILDKFGLQPPEDGAVILGSSSKPTVEGEQQDPVAPPPAAEPGEEPPELEDDDDDGGSANARMARSIQLRLMRKVVDGETLTSDQREFLALFQQHDGDSVDQLVAKELDGWEQIMNPVMAPILELAEKSSTFREFSDDLKKISNQIDVDPFVRSLAEASLKARGLGDGTDDPKA